MKLFRNLWCALFHGRYTSQRSAAGDWCQLHCSRCGELPACVNCGAARAKLCNDGWCPAAEDSSQRTVKHSLDWRAFSAAVNGEDRYL